MEGPCEREVFVDEILKLVSAEDRRELDLVKGGS
jgi:hypothetical protein